jgi:protein TonB
MPTAQAPARPGSEEFVPFLPLLTFTLWTITFTVGGLGLLLPYPRPSASPTPQQAVQTQLVNVEIPKETPPPQAPIQMPPPDLGTPSPDLSAPPAPQQASIPEAPAIAVAAPSPSISFALPVEGLTKLVDASQAAHGRPTPGPVPSTNASSGSAGGSAQPASGALATLPPITLLTFGEGEGRQPPPQYPREAQLAGQEGSVTIRFAVDETGRVTTLATPTPSHWPLLNQAASRAIRNTWRFAPGPPRTYEVTIEFQLQK